MQCIPQSCRKEEKDTVSVNHTTNIRQIYNTVAGKEKNSVYQVHSNNIHQLYNTVAGKEKKCLSSTQQ